VTLPEAVTGELAGKFGEISLFNQHTDFELGSDSNSNKTPRGPSHVSRLLSHLVRISHSTSISHTTSATLARPMRRLSLRAEPTRRSSPTRPRTSTPPSAITRTPPMSLTSDRTPTSPSPRSPRPSNRRQGRLPAWL
jgi:hypothetical protein